MSTLTGTVETQTQTPPAVSTPSSESRPWWRPLAEFGRGLFWALFGLGGHLLLALAALVLLVSLIVGPILLLAGVIEFVSWLFD